MTSLKRRKETGPLAAVQRAALVPPFLFNAPPPPSCRYVQVREAIITTGANELAADIHDRMPVILAPGDFTRWLGEEPHPRDLMRPFSAEPMRMWPISTRVNKPENDDTSIIEPVVPATDAA